MGKRPVIDGVTLPLKEQLCSLAVLLDPSLSLEAQVDSMAWSTWGQLWLICQLRPVLDRDNLTIVVHALVTYRLDYCNALYVGLPLKMTQKLQLVQNAAARLLTGTSYKDHITPVLKELHQLPIHFQSEFKILTMTFKALNSLGPQYLRERLFLNIPA